MRKKYALSSALWFLFFATLFLGWVTYVEPDVYWRLAAQNWAAPLFASMALSGLWVLFGSLPNSEGSPPIFAKKIGNTAGLIGAASAVGFLWVWGETSVHAINMVKSGLGGALALATLATLIAFVRVLVSNTEQTHRPLDLSKAES